MQLLEKINPKIKEKIVLALDVDTVDEAKQLISELKDYVGVFKVGLQMYTGCGEEIIKSKDIRILCLQRDELQCLSMDVFGMAMIAETQGLKIIKSIGKRKENEIQFMTKA